MLKISNLSKSYGQRRVLKSISIEFQIGSFNLIIGSNGSGKTTLLESIMEMDSSIDGEISFNGLQLKQYFEENYPRVSLLNDQVFIYDYLTVKQYIDFILSLKKRDITPTLKIEKERLLDSLGLRIYINNYCKDLSLGNKRKLYVLPQILSSPKLIIGDEPFNGLDHESRNFLLREFCEMSKSGSTIVISSHNLEDKYEIFDNIFQMKNGTLIKI